MLTIGRLPSAFGHPATVYHKTIVLCTLALTEWPLRRGGLTRSLTESGMYQYYT
jgi:hypothetical protein